VKHHFGDLLSRDEGYWTIVPNRERHAYRIEEMREGDPGITIATIGKGDEHWARVLTFPALEELTLHEPSPEQLEAIRALRGLRRLRITHARPKNIEFISGLQALEELVLEYVAGFDDLAPLSGLGKLRALHFENLRRVVDFGGLAGARGLRYLAVLGTLDRKQPINDLEFLRGLPALEVLKLWEIKVRARYPALLPALSLENLESLRVHSSYLPAEECALLEVGLPKVAGTQWGAYCTTARDSQPPVFEFTGLGAGSIKCSSPLAEARCREYAQRYEAMKQRARALISGG
jgi:hypothetical protein